MIFWLSHIRFLYHFALLDFSYCWFIYFKHWFKKLRFIYYTIQGRFRKIKQYTFELILVFVSYFPSKGMSKSVEVLFDITSGWKYNIFTLQCIHCLKCNTVKLMICCEKWFEVLVSSPASSFDGCAIIGLCSFWIVLFRNFGHLLAPLVTWWQWNWFNIYFQYQIFLLYELLAYLVWR